jgi:aminoglycoside phosphotransferase (APT) family kinase protein
VLVPRVLAEDAGDPPAVPPLFVMEFVPGESYEPMQSDDQGRSSATDEEVSQRALAAVGMLVEMHRLDPGLLAVGDEPLVTPADELRRWHRAFATTEGDLHPEIVDQAYQLLAAEIPEPMRAVVSHGDWRLGNMQCQGGEIRGVIDWEIWSLGDPRLDLSWLLLMADPVRRGAIANPGMPCPARLLAAYECQSGNRLAGMKWFGALVRFKQAAASALICKNSRKAPIPNKRGLAMVELVPSLACRAVELLTAQS